MKGLGRHAQIYIAVIIATGLVVLFLTVTSWTSADFIRFATYMIVAVLASGLKVTLPGITGTMSISSVVILLSVVELAPSETVSISCVALVAQTYWHAKKRPSIIQALFNVSSIAMATAAACLVYRHTSSVYYAELLLGVSVCTYFLINTLSIACVVSLVEGKRLFHLWRECYFWSFPYYLAGAVLASLISRLNHYISWQVSLLLFPVLYLIYRTYSLYLGRLESEQQQAIAEKKHAEAMAALHLRTIEAMALAIEAQDTLAHHHLARVQIYAVALGQDLGISASELEALRAASILHDIGKLAIPEHIISKPGKLTPEEFEKMKIHPVVGSEILERVQFPYPVASIVRCHHERWDGSGYPDGLAGEKIPIGARILAAVDCFHALASDRPYRRAIPLDEAMQVVIEGAGKDFDPQVVKVLRLRYRELEQAASAAAAEHRAEKPQISKGGAPAAGFENSGSKHADQPEFLLSIAAAREEMQMLLELTNDLGNSLSLHQTLSVLDARLKPMIPYNSIAVYIRQDGCLLPKYVQGDDFQIFSSLEIPLGEGLSGWVGRNSKPVINGDPALESAYLRDPAKSSTLRAGLAVPLEGVDGMLGVLTLYSSRRDAFSRDHLRLLLAISSKAALAVENAIRHQQAEMSATIDALTGLPNARALFLQLDAELSRCQRSGAPLAVLVCDLDGFKQVNDRFGHLEGNRVLKLVAQGLQDICRGADYVARMGGDEFVIILPGGQPGTIDQQVFAFNNMVRRVGVEVCGEEFLSISVGEAYYPQHGKDAEQLLAQADRRMYKVKQEQKMNVMDQSRPVPALSAAAH